MISSQQLPRLAQTRLFHSCWWSLYFLLNVLRVLYTGEEKAVIYLMGRVKKEELDSQMLLSESSGHKSKHRKFYMSIKKNQIKKETKAFLWWLSNSRTGSPEAVEPPLVVKHWKREWRGSWATCCSWARGWMRWSTEVPSNLNSSVITWFKRQTLWSTGDTLKGQLVFLFSEQPVVASI